MVLENVAYVPTLAIRPSEMNGLEFLPGATKDRITPCFLLAPWVNSSNLDRSIDRIDRAFPKRRYFLDLDRDYQFTNLDSEPQRQLAALTDPSDCYSNWVNFVGRFENVWPCIQTRSQSDADIRNQIESFQGLGRSYCMRIVRDRFPDNLDQIIDAFAAGGAADFAVILEGGWTRDPLTLSAWFDGVIAGSLQRIDASVPIVLSCTSIPKMFEEYNHKKPSLVAFRNRQLVEQVARNTNRARVIYGDWGSTRPREQSGIASRPLDRVDYPTENAWYIARNKDERWDFSNAASAIVESDVWDGKLGVWGEQMIENTVINKQLGIDTPQKNVASRVNIHLHRQAFYGGPTPTASGLDEDWED